MIKRMKVTLGAVLILFAALAAYVGVLSLGSTAAGVNAAVGSRQKTVRLYTTRGTIYDRDLAPLTNVDSNYHLLIDPHHFERTDVPYLAKLCGMSVETLIQKLDRGTTFTWVCTKRPKSMQGVYVYEGVRRYTDLAAHLVGYVDGDGRGVAGLEKCYDRQLRYFGGEKSVTFAADALRNPMAGLGFTITGDDGNYKDGLVTTLDMEIQRAAQRALSEKTDKGAAVVLDTETGAIRAIASLPTFDPGNIAGEVAATDGRLVDRALVGQTVGSVFKIVVTVAAIEAGLDGFTYTCHGGIGIGGRTFTCQKEEAHGHMTLETAFCRSCNVYYIALGQMLGEKKIVETAKRLGFSERQEIADGFYAAAGNLPAASGSSAQRLANLSIGQGELLATPLQIARLAALCANGGYLLHPTLVKGFYVSGKIEGDRWLRYRERVIEEKTAEKLKAFCIRTVEEGTGKNAKPSVGGAGGKTASAQTGVSDADGKEMLNVYFAGFYPAQKPQYAIAVFAENGTSGGATCAPVFREICEQIAAKKH